MEHDPNCHVELYYKPYDEKEVSKISNASLTVRGMGCPNCAIRVRNAILRLDGVNWVDVNLESGTAVVAYHANAVSPQQFITAIAEADPQGRHHYLAALIS
jgi:copper chaperone CopZ